MRQWRHFRYRRHLLCVVVAVILLNGRARRTNSSVVDVDAENYFRRKQFQAVQRAAEAAVVYPKTTEALVKRAAVPVVGLFLLDPEVDVGAWPVSYVWSWLRFSSLSLASLSG